MKKHTQKQENKTKKSKNVSGITQTQNKKEMISIAKREEKRINET